MYAAEFWSERVEMMQAWADYLDDPSRALTAENSSLKAETGVRFPLGSASKINILAEFGIETGRTYGKSTA
jgi:hypothetical protein